SGTAESALWRASRWRIYRHRVLSAVRGGTVGLRTRSGAHAGVHAPNPDSSSSSRGQPSHHGGESRRLQRAVAAGLSRCLGARRGGSGLEPCASGSCSLSCSLVGSVATICPLRWLGSVATRHLTLPSRGRVPASF